MAAGFRVRRDISDKGFTNLPISSLALAAADLIELLTGAVSWTKVTGTSNHFTRKAIVKKATTTSDTEVQAIELDGTEHIEADVANNSDAAHNGDLMIATDENTIANTGTNVTGQAAIFVQIAPLGINTEKRVLGRVLVGNGVDPDAA